MEIPLTQALAACEQCAEKIDDILRHADGLPLRASQIAELLHVLWPSSPVYGCLLEAAGESHLCVLDQSGKLRVEWAERLRSSMQEAGKHVPEDPASLDKLPQALKLPGRALATVAITFRAQNRGALAIAVPKNVSAETFALLRVLLRSAADHLAAYLVAEANERQLEVLKKEGEVQNWLANTGEMAGPLAHEVNNFLNIVLLHVALIEAELPQKLRSELTELRRQAASITATVKQFQQIRRRQHPVPEPVDINQQVGDAVRSLTDSSEPNQPLVIKLPPSSRIETTGLGRPAAVPLHLVLAPDLPPILGSAADLKRLCTFLLTNAAHAAGPLGGSVTIRTAASGSNVVLCVEDDGPSVPPELLPQLFEPSTMGRANTSTLELAACEALVRRLHGKIRCENRATQGLAVIVELPKA
ncbi:MAG TPA: HAMP domain-containing sensor histidine kinase [Gemmataceae bacterium]|nr:HAMP domain-containing sensor histidine kinase [Gemmataceae bacterium]